jgi:hypothetical protein
LYLPVDGQCGWGYRWNQNANTLDTLPNKGSSNTWTAGQTFNGGITLGPGQGIPHGMQLSTCLPIQSLDATDDNLQIDIFPYTVTATHIACECMRCDLLLLDCCSTTPVFSLSDQTGNAITISGTLTCPENSISSWVTIDQTDPDRIMGSGEGPRISTTSAGASLDTVMVCIRYTVD